MLKKWTPNSFTFPPHITILSCAQSIPTFAAYSLFPVFGRLKLSSRRVSRQPLCNAKRRAKYEHEEEDEEEEYNREIAILEMYTQSTKDEVLLVQALVDEELLELIIFKGFSSCLSYKTCSDPSRSVVPGRAVIKSIDRVKGPFNPSHIHYIEEGLTFDAFKIRLNQINQTI